MSLAVKGPFGLFHVLPCIAIAPSGTVSCHMFPVRPQVDCRMNAIFPCLILVVVVQICIRPSTSLYAELPNEVFRQP